MLKFNWFCLDFGRFFLSEIQTILFGFWTFVSVEIKIPGIWILALYCTSFEFGFYTLIFKKIIWKLKTVKCWNSTDLILFGFRTLFFLKFKRFCLDFGRLFLSKLKFRAFGFRHFTVHLLMLFFQALFPFP